MCGTIVMPERHTDSDEICEQALDRPSNGNVPFKPEIPSIQRGAGGLDTSIRRVSSTLNSNPLLIVYESTEWGCVNAISIPGYVNGGT